jgi:hypothetical protein
MAKFTKSKPSTATSRATDLLRTDREHRTRMIEQLFCVILECAKEQGLSESQSQHAFQRAQRHWQDSPYRVGDAVRFATLLQIAELLAVWYREPVFLDNTGRPKALRLSGPDSFGTLAQRFMPEFDTSEVATILVSERLLLRRPNGRVIPKSRAALFATANPMMLDRIPVLVKGLVTTLAHNADRAARKSGTRCERSTHLARLPVELVPAFNEHVKRLAQSLLNSTDSWAQPRLLKPGGRPRRSTASVGVEVFSYIFDETPNPARKRTRSAR